MNKCIKYLILPVLSIMLLTTACHKDLDLTPKYGFNSSAVYDTADNYVNVIAKLYAGFVLSGNEGPAGNPDIADIDEGFSPYLRVYWNLQELPTDEAKCRWNDPGIPELNNMQWGAANSFTKAMYSRLFFQITLANEFIRECSEDNMERRGFSESDRQMIRAFRSEARWIRAFVWMHAIDLFGGNVPFVTEADGIGSRLPSQTNAADLFEYVESELLDIELNMLAAGTAEYGRADQGAVWFVLAQLYLNAEAWIGQDRYADAQVYVEKIINSGAYSLEENYEYLFTLNNENSPEAIWSVLCDGAFTQSYGGTTFLVHAFVGGAMNPDEFGIADGWVGYRATKAFTDIYLQGDTCIGCPTPIIEKAESKVDGSQGMSTLSYPFDDICNLDVAVGQEIRITTGAFNGCATDWPATDYLYTVESIDGAKVTFTVPDSAKDVLNCLINNLDTNGIKYSPIFFEFNVTFYMPSTSSSDRFTWFTAGHTQKIEDATVFENGWAQTKYKNVFLDGCTDFTAPDNYSLNSQVNLDFHWMRLGEAYLMYAELAARGYGSAATGLNYINMLRERANEETVSSYDLDFILEERGRELAWEGKRRTDLIRFNKFTTSEYVWEWKGGDAEGVGVEDFRNIYPLNADDVIANPNLTQNPGY